MSDTITDLLHADTDELFEQLGRDLLGSGPGFGPSGRAGFRDFGERWFHGNLQRVRESVCPNRAVRALIESPKSGDAVAVATLQELLSQVDGIGAYATVVSVLAVKLGLATLCAGFDDDPSAG